MKTVAPQHIARTMEKLSRMDDSMFRSERVVLDSLTAAPAPAVRIELEGPSEVQKWGERMGIEVAPVQAVVIDPDAALEARRLAWRCVSIRGRSHTIQEMHATYRREWSRRHVSASVFWPEADARIGVAIQNNRHLVHNGSVPARILDLMDQWALGL